MFDLGEEGDNDVREHDDVEQLEVGLTLDVVVPTNGGSEDWIQEGHVQSAYGDQGHEHEQQTNGIKDEGHSGGGSSTVRGSGGRKGEGGRTLHGVHQGREARGEEGARGTLRV